MNLNYIIKQFKKIGMIENYITYKSLSQYYNIKPSKKAVNKEIKHNSKNIIDMDDDTILLNSIIHNELSPKGKHIRNKYIQQKILKKNKFVSPIKPFTYPLSLSNSQSNKLLLKSSSSLSISQINNELFQKEVNDKINKPKITLKPCKSFQCKDISKEEHVQMIDKLKKTFNKEFYFSAENIPKVTIGDFRKRDKYSNDHVNILIEKRKKFDSRMSIISLGKNGKVFKKKKSLPLSEKRYEEVDRGVIVNPMKSFVINKPYIPEMRRTFNASRKSGKKSKERMMKYLQRITIYNRFQNDNRNSKDHLLLVIRGDRKIDKGQQTIIQK